MTKEEVIADIIETLRLPAATDEERRNIEDEITRCLYQEMKTLTLRGTHLLR